ncbi:hypothetical protein B296_00041497 [Ensete ventricosum]|uniref:Uncharacterized protein n=1 Tax=Ensete ventricosum TaxID=4639 RepID=A0A426YBY7_ENSVE|nr:hypothetical protein B296_00041497 [Ensete ventricosum]
MKVGDGEFHAGADSLPPREGRTPTSTFFFTPGAWHGDPHTILFLDPHPVVRVSVTACLLEAITVRRRKTK